MKFRLVEDYEVSDNKTVKEDTPIKELTNDELQWALEGMLGESLPINIEYVSTENDGEVFEVSLEYLFVTPKRTIMFPAHGTYETKDYENVDTDYTGYFEWSNEDEELNLMEFVALFVKNIYEDECPYNAENFRTAVKKSHWKYR